jgi:iron-sulfur cluster assembly accessory protein
MLTMTERAAEKIRHFAGEMPEAQGKELRIFVQAGGCSGLQYGFTFDEHQEGDTVVESSGITVLVDPMSAPHLSGAQVDFVDDERGTGFIVDNPNAAPSCGCSGTSSCC